MAKDPYKYFRIEARELIDGLTRGVLDLEGGAPSADVRPRLLRLAHTLKGAARVVKQSEIAELVHTLEDALGGDSHAGFQAGACLELLDGIAAKVRALDDTTGAEAGGRATPRPTRALDDDRIEAHRVEVGDLDALHGAVLACAVHMGEIREAARAASDIRAMALALVEILTRVQGGAHDSVDMATRLDAALARMEAGTARAIERAEKDLAGIRDIIARLRLAPARSIFGALERAARDAARATGTSVSFEATGGDIHVDGQVLAGMRSALIHVVRNAIAHGSESDEMRRASGKPPALRVQILVERRGDRIAFVCVDDGRGVDVEAVRRAAVHRGVVGADVARAMDERAVVRLILEGGVTTTSGVTELSGRGVGLDVVREVAVALRGDVDISTEPGRGTRVELCVPVSLWSLAVLVVGAAGQSLSIPLDAVLGTLRVGARDVVRTADGETILYRGVPIPLFSLERLIGGRSSSGRSPASVAHPDSPDRARTVVVLTGSGEPWAVAVDRLVGTTNAAIRPLSGLLGAAPVVMGAALDVRGDPEIVLDPVELLRAARTTGAPEREAPAGRRRPVLIIDDSLTTRMLEQSILESAGYDVELCTSAEEALAAAGAKPEYYGLFVVDVEMPGMDGFEFVARTRADPRLSDTPAVLVTSLGSVEDRERGARAGARGYIVKSEFDQSYLLGLVRDLAR